MSFQTWNASNSQQNINELQEHTTWTGRDIVNETTDQCWCRLLACVEAEDGHFEHHLQAYEVFVKILC